LRWDSLQAVRPRIRLSLPRFLVGLLISVPLLAGCSGGGLLEGGIFDSGGVTGLACPRVAVLDAPGEITRFVGAPTGSISDVLFQAKMEITGVSCEIEKEAVYVTSDASLFLMRGPAEQKGEIQFAFFVAVLNGQKQVILRQAFPVIVKFKGDESRLDFKDSVTIEIKKEQNVDAATYTIYAGFELTPEELEFNRRRLR